MSIADKLSYIQETKALIKDAIVSKGVQVSDTDSFRSYADKIGSIETSEEICIVPNGDNPKILLLGNSYDELGAKVYCGDVELGLDVEIVSSIDVSIVADYVVTYTVKDVNGNVCAEATRIVVVTDMTPPEITYSQKADEGNYYTAKR